MVSKLYKPVSLGAGMLGGMLAGALVKRIWKLAVGDDEMPEATDEHRGWIEILLAAALTGAVSGVIRAAINRATAEGTRRMTGTWPVGNEQEPSRRKAA